MKKFNKILQQINISIGHYSDSRARYPDYNSISDLNAIKTAKDVFLSRLQQLKEEAEEAKKNFLNGELTEELDKEYISIRFLVNYYIRKLGN